MSRALLTTYIVQSNSGRCNDAAYKYSINNIRPLEKQLTSVNTSLNRLAEKGQVAWAIDIVGEDMFDAESVNILYQIIDSRRANTLKEALNKYDEEMYRRNMQAMQLAAQQAAEEAAQAMEEGWITLIP